LAKDGRLTEEQVNKYLYKAAIGEINESLIKISDESRTKKSHHGKNKCFKSSRNCFSCVLFNKFISPYPV
jgi:hypothetical protein